MIFRALVWSLVNFSMGIPLKLEKNKVSNHLGHVCVRLWQFPTAFSLFQKPHVCTKNVFEYICWLKISIPITGWHINWLSLKTGAVFKSHLRLLSPLIGPNRDPDSYQYNYKEWSPLVFNSSVNGKWMATPLKTEKRKWK